MPRRSRAKSRAASGGCCEGFGVVVLGEEKSKEKEMAN